MNARRLAVELQLSAKRGTASGEQVNAVVETLLEMADKLERLEAENAGLRVKVGMSTEFAAEQTHKLEAYEQVFAWMSESNGKDAVSNYTEALRKAQEAGWEG